MKTRCFIIGLTMLLALSACHMPTREARRMVARAERLADSLPDSTICLIDSVLHMPVNFSERERMDMALLQGEVLFRDASLDNESFWDSVSISPELEHAADYYAKKKQYVKAAHAAIFSGYVQQQYNDKASAMQSFKDAEKYGTFSGDSLIVARSRFYIGRMLHGDDMVNEAIAILQSAASGFGNHYSERALVENMMAVSYMVLHNFDQAEKCLQQSLKYAEKGHSDKTARKALNNYAVLLRLQGHYMEAVDYLRVLLYDSQIDETEVLPTILNLGKAFDACGMADSADFYYQRLKALLPHSSVKAETQASAYNALSLFAESKGEHSLALLYRKQYENVLNEIMVKKERNSIYGIQRKYDYETIRNTMNRKLINRQRLIMVIGGLFLLAVILILALQIKQRQMKEAEERMQRQLNLQKQELSQSVKTTFLDENLSARLRLMLLANRTEKRALDPKKEWHPLVLQVMNGENDLYEAAKIAVEKAYPDLLVTLRQKYPDLNETEIRVCLMSCTDLSNAEISELLQLSLNTVNKSRSNLRKKLCLETNKLKEQLRDTLTKPKNI